MRGVLLTGATGFVGGVLLGRLLEARPAVPIFCLIRAGDDERLEARRQRLLSQAGIGGAAAERVVAVRGDVMDPGLGIGDARAAVARQIDEIFHAAASTKFDLEIDDARGVNLGGTRHVLEFARSAAGAGGLRRLHHVSTAYVAGGASGVIHEDSACPDTQFRNTYEQTKWEAEELLAGDRGVPFTCYRPSIVVGDSVTGWTQHFRVLYDPMRWIYGGKIAILPCRPDVRLDVVPVDYVCDALVALSENGDAIGQTYHLSCGPEGALTIDEIVDHSVAAANAYHAEQGMDPIPRPATISPDQFESAVGEQRDQLEKIFALGEAVMHTHMPYMLTDQTFDTTRTRKALAGTGVECPPFGAYIDRVVRWGVERGFGAA